MITLNSRTVPGPVLHRPAAPALPPEASADPPAPAPLTASTVVGILAWATATLERLVLVASQRLPPATAECQPSCAKIKAAVAHLSGVSLLDIESHRRALRIAQPRQVAMALCRELTKCSLPAIGRCFDRDHSTVSHAVQAVARERRKGNQAVIALYEAAKRRLQG